MTCQLEPLLQQTAAGIINAIQNPVGTVHSPPCKGKAAESTSFPRFGSPQGCFPRGQPPCLSGAEVLKWEFPAHLPEGSDLLLKELDSSLLEPTGRKVTHYQQETAKAKNNTRSKISAWLVTHYTAALGESVQQ